MRLAKLALSIAFAAASAGPVLVLSGCGGVGANVGETHVGKQELYRTGNFDYDEFFEDVHGLQDSAKAIVADEKAARVPLGQVLGIGETSIDRMLEVLRDKAEEFAQSKNRVHFAIEGVDDQGKPLAGQQVTVTPSAAKGKQVPKDAGGVRRRARADGPERRAGLGKVRAGSGPKQKARREGRRFEGLARERVREDAERKARRDRARAFGGQAGERGHRRAFREGGGQLAQVHQAERRAPHGGSHAEIKPQDKSAKGPKGKPTPAAAPPKPKDVPAKPKEPAKPAAADKADKPDKPEKPAPPPAPKPAAGEGGRLQPLNMCDKTASHVEPARPGHTGRRRRGHPGGARGEGRGRPRPG